MLLPYQQVAPTIKHIQVQQVDCRIKFRCYMFCFVLLLTDVPLKLPFTRMEKLLENKTDSTADFIVFPPFNLGFLLTSVFFRVYLSVNLYVEL